MGIIFDPTPGLVLMCNFGTGFKKPEMVKNRPVIVISRKLKDRAGLCTVVPLSTREPDVIKDWHHKLSNDSLPVPYHTKDTWAKCDMVITVAYHRLDRVRIGKDSNGKRMYSHMCITQDEFAAIKTCVVQALNLGAVITN